MYCTALIKVTYRNDQALDSPAVIEVNYDDTSVLTNAQTLDNIIEDLKENENVLKFTCFLYHSAYRREEVWSRST